MYTLLVPCLCYKNSMNLSDFPNCCAERKYKINVLDPGKGVCVDPRRGDAILGVGGPGPPKGDDEYQLSPDRGGEKT
jgi:hypothetical protein